MFQQRFKKLEKNLQNAAGAAAAPKSDAQNTRDDYPNKKSLIIIFSPTHHHLLYNFEGQAPQAPHY
jgi:hypothetical protein